MMSLAIDKRQLTGTGGDALTKKLGGLLGSEWGNVLGLGLPDLVRWRRFESLLVRSLVGRTA